jgi:formylmethanofuran dehydrogenase subunit C
MSRTLTFTTPPPGAIDSDLLAPGRLPARPEDALAITLRCGREQIPLGNLCRISGGDPDDTLRIEGVGLELLRGLGRGMTSGRLIVDGPAGDDLGSELAGGSIEVAGNVGACAGMGMTGGSIRIGGDAGDALGGAVPGAKAGMRGGTILVRGRAGNDVGRSMRRGTIAVQGGAGDGFGINMIAGTLAALGPLGIATGLGMRRGTILARGPIPHLLPTFRHNGPFRSPFLALLWRHLLEIGLELPDRQPPPIMERWLGDLAERGQGEILIPGI